MPRLTASLSKCGRLLLVCADFCRNSKVAEDVVDAENFTKRVASEVRSALPTVLFNLSPSKTVGKRVVSVPVEMSC